MKSPLILVFIFIATAALSQDSLIVKAIDAQASKNYDRINHTDWYLTHNMVVSVSGHAGTQLSYHYDDEDVLMPTGRESGRPDFYLLVRKLVGFLKKF